MSMDILPNNTHVKLGVIMDDLWVSTYGSSSQQIQEAISSAAATADEELFANGQIEIEFIGADQEPADYGAGSFTSLPMTGIGPHVCSNLMMLQHFHDLWIFNKHCQLRLKKS